MHDTPQPRRSPRYWRKTYPGIANSRRVARILADMAADHRDWIDVEVLAWYDYTGEHA